MKPSLFGIAVLLSLAGALAAHPANSIAQTTTETPAAGAQTTNPPPAQKKVWTNDDIDQLRDSEAGGISVVGNTPAPPSDATANQKGAGAPAKPGAAEPKVPKEKDPEWYREQLTPLYAALSKINDQIAAAQSAVDGDTRGDAGVSMNVRAPAGTPQEQLVALQKEQSAVQGKIDDLLDMARHNDIPPGDLPSS